jgi:glyoxylase-like metal-dependent hydrolase (beta-lactamase superfamily II)/8-oxo-dGTP pyrophosphatase MutT (NUDIX family)
VPAADCPLRPAATLIVAREAVPAGMEVLLMRRASRGDQFSGAWVFPGGQVDAGDRQSHRYCAGLDDAAASLRLSLAQGGLDYYIAAIRECFEEAGILFAAPAASDSDSLPQDYSTEAAQWRADLQCGELDWNSLCQRFGLRLNVDELHYLSHWITPPGMPKRFDTRFFLARLPAGQNAVHDGTELVEQQWIAPADALARSRELKLVDVTHHTLATLTQFQSVAALLDWVREPRDIPVTLPRWALGADGVRVVMPHEWAWAEIGRLDPDGQGTVSCELTAGVAVRLSERVIRVTANNGSLMTGPGTNSYLVGGGAANQWAVIDPGPYDEHHVGALLAAAPGPIRWILATHTHKDHSPAVALLKARTGARVYGRIADHTHWQDATFVPDQLLSDGQRISLPGPCTLRAIHTPGHASNHFCYLLEEEKLLFTGDQVMQASTVVINPPDGDMAAYLRSLSALLNEDLDWLAPGHGFLMAEPARAITHVIQHRHRREAKVLRVLHSHEPIGEDELLARVYDDVAAPLHSVARRSLLAHLFKLRDEGLAGESEGLWRCG